MKFVFVISLSLVLLTLGHQLAAVGGKDQDDENNGVLIKCFDKERLALLDFKAHLHDLVGVLNTWSPVVEDDCCKWTGVTCNNQTGHVTKLDLSVFYGRSLEGEISPSLLNLTYLQHLDLSDKSFNGTIPSFIGSLARLTYLDLHGNFFHGTIPKFFGSMTRLVHLDLAVNDLEGIVPPEIGNLTNLRYLSLALVGTCTIENLDWLPHLTHLELLTLDGISLAKANHWLDVISGFQNLSYLSLYECNLSQVLYPYSSSFFNHSSSSSIATIDLSKNNLNSSMYHWLFPLTSNRLVQLYLYQNLLDSVPKYLGNLCSLKFLYLTQNSLSVEFPDILKNLSGCTSGTLQKLDLSNNHLTGSLPDQIQNFSSLRWLYLDKNHFSGNISEKVWKLPRLESLYLGSNSFTGHVLFENFGTSKVSELDLSNNSIKVIPSDIHLSNRSYIEYIYLSSCKLGPGFPKWIQMLTNLTYLDIANTRIGDIIPMSFWKMWPSQLTHLNLSSNNINAIVPDLLSNFDLRQPLEIDLSNNSFHGPIPNVPSTLLSLNLSSNKFNGGLSFLCQIVDGMLLILDLSYNLLTGQLPDCLWHFKNLIVLNLAHNNLFGKLPASLGYMVKLEVLYLRNNSFSGYLPLSLKNFTKLNFLELGSNSFFGNVPVWIGENLSGLSVLILRENNFSGVIPIQFCQLVSLHILDLSLNNLNGTIPSCVNNLTTMVQKAGFSKDPNVHELTLDNYPAVGGFLSLGMSGEYFDYAIVEWLGHEREFYKIDLQMVKIINLSSNNLTGQIPNEVTDLRELHVLNLSKNALLGEIPPKIGEMSELLTFDVSNNKVSGKLPSTMSQMTSLQYLDVSYNNLSGRIPSSTQLQSFDPSKYKGNTALCGLPITRTCPGDDTFVVPPVVDESVGDNEGKYELERYFYIGGAAGFATGFWIACSLLLLNRHGRHLFFRFLDSINDWVYVKVVLFIAKVREVAHTL